MLKTAKGLEMECRMERVDISIRNMRLLIIHYGQYVLLFFKVRKKAMSKLTQFFFGHVLKLENLVVLNHFIDVVLSIRGHGIQVRVGVHSEELAESIVISLQLVLDRINNLLLPPRFSNLEEELRIVG
mmetsp:Transcript_19789/g.14524  ORF Transcript_19789/g.14524 Transcript_19789/m.14524 type:complete len:128 (+) Transcript_19789:751-1134(+)